MITNLKSNDVKTIGCTPGIHPAWVALIRHCQAISHGELARVRIQDGVPVLIEKSVERIKLI